MADHAVEHDLERPRPGEAHRRFDQHGDQDDREPAAVGAHEIHDEGSHAAAARASIGFHGGRILNRFGRRLLPLQRPVVERGALARVELDDLEVGREVEVARHAERRMARPQQAAPRAARRAGPGSAGAGARGRCRACGARAPGRIGNRTRPKASASSDEQIVSVSRPLPKCSASSRSPGGIIWKGSRYRVRSQKLRRSYWSRCAR